jgi:membrane protein
VETMASIPLREVGPLLRVTGEYWYSDRAPRMGAALAYYMALSLAPSLVIMLAIAGFAFSAKTAEGGLLWQTRDMLGPEGAMLIQTIVEGAHRSQHGLAATVLGLFTFFFGATAAINELRDDLNTVWQVPDDPTWSHARSAYNIVKDRFLSLAIVLGAGVYLLASLTLNLWVSAAYKFLNPAADPPHLLSQATGWLVSFVAITVLFALIFKMMPNVSLEWGDVAIGAVFTSLIFTAGKFLLGLYLAGAGFTDTYGAAGSLVILLVWVYSSAQVFLFGAEFTRAYTNRFGSKSHLIVLK